MLFELPKIIKIVKQILIITRIFLCCFKPDIFIFAKLTLIRQNLRFIAENNVKTC